MLQLLLLFNILITVVDCQSIPWLIQTVPVFTPNTTNTPNYVDTSTRGSSNFEKAVGIPMTDGEIFINTLFYNPTVLDNVRLYSRYGQPLLNISSDNTGAAFTVVKTVGSASYVITCTYYSANAPNHFKIQTISILADVFAVSGSPLIRTDYRVQNVIDQTGSVYIYGGDPTTVSRYSSVDGYQVAKSAALGSSTYYPYRMFEVPSLDAVFVYFAHHYAGLFACPALNILGSKLVTDTTKDTLIQSVSDDTIFWNVKSPDEFNTYLQRRVLTNDASLFTVTQSSGLLAFYEGTLAQLGNFGIVMVSPYHVDTWTNSVLRGIIFFFREDDLSYISYTPPNNWLLLRMTMSLSNPPGEEGGRRFYMMFSDATTMNVHSYYFLVDTCMSPQDSSLSCSVCPTGYWRASASLPIPRRCVAPVQFPPATGMLNSTMTYETCLVANCVQCTFDISRCSLCDTPAGYYLSPGVASDQCITKPQILPRFGVDSTGTKVVACSDSNCLNCTDSFDRCAQCDTAAQYYMLQHACIGKSDIPPGQGVDGHLAVQPCLRAGCVDCFDDFSVCLRCDVLQNLILDLATRTCLSEKQFPANYGPDLKSGVLTSCADLSCFNCQENHKECVMCNSPDFFILNGVCRSFMPVNAPKIAKTKFYESNLTAEVLFDQKVNMNYTQDFFRLFEVVVEDLIERKKHRCILAKVNQESLRCLLIVTESGFSILFDTDLVIAYGSLFIAPGESVSSSLPTIFGRSTKQPFRGFPILIEGFSSDSATLVITSAQVMSKVNAIKPYLSILLALISLSLSVLLDKYIITLQYLSLLEGPLLIHPQQVFDIVLMVSNYLSTDLLPSAATLSVFAKLSDCKPSTAFSKQEFECSVIGNVGPDTFAAVFIAATCLLITLVCNKIVDNRIQSYGKIGLSCSPGDESGPPNNVRRLAEIMHKSNSSSNSDMSAVVLLTQRDSVADRTDSSNKSTALTSQEISFLPSGKIHSNQIPSGRSLLSFCLATREIYGISFFLVKMEANQFKIIVVVFLNYWNYHQGRLEQYSLIAAIIFTLYYIFQGYFTYQFADNIWKEANKSDRLQEYAVKVDAGSEGPQQVSQLKTAGEKEGKSPLLKTMVPDLLSGANKDLRANFFDHLRLPDRFYKLCVPLVSLGRCTILAGTLVMLSSRPSVQVIFAIIVEIAYLVFIIKGAKPVSLFYHTIQVCSVSLVITYLGMKLITISDYLSDERRQRAFGLSMAWILLLYLLCGLIILLVEVAKFLQSKLKSCRQHRVAPEMRDSKLVKQVQSELPESSATDRHLQPDKTPSTQVTKAVASHLPVQLSKKSAVGARIVTVSRRAAMIAKQQMS